MEKFREVIKCPNCHSEMINYAKNGFSAKKSIAGLVLFGGVGLFAGCIGKNKIKATCLACGHKFNAEEGYQKIYYKEDNPSFQPANDNIRIKDLPKKYYSEEEMKKKIIIAERLFEKGLITLEELNKRKKDLQIK